MLLHHHHLLYTALELKNYLCAVKSVQINEGAFLSQAFQQNLRALAPAVVLQQQRAQCINVMHDE